LREEFPHLQIDNCASGGRRLDFELLRFSVPLWYSDMQCFENFDPQMVLTQISGLSSYLPVFACGTQNKQGGDTYNFRVSMANGLDVHWFYNSEFAHETYPHTWLRERLLEFLQVRECFAGDIYWLAAPEPSCRNMSVMQYDLPECGKGIVLVARDKKCPELARIIKLHGLNHEMKYRIWDADGAIKSKTITGKQLSEEGIVVKIDKPQTALLIQYSTLQ
jgi:alpha-galactosidase